MGCSVACCQQQSADNSADNTVAVENGRNFISCGSWELGAGTLCWDKKQQSLVN